MSNQNTRAPPPVLQKTINLVEEGQSGTGYFPSTWDYQDNKLLVAGNRGVRLENGAEYITNVISNIDIGNVGTGNMDYVSVFTGGSNPYLNQSNIIFSDANASNFNSISTQGNIFIGSDSNIFPINLIDLTSDDPLQNVLAYIPSQNTIGLTAGLTGGNYNLAIFQNSGSPQDISIVNQSGGQVGIFSANSAFIDAGNTGGISVGNQLYFNSGDETYLASGNNINVFSSEKIIMNCDDTFNIGAINDINVNTSIGDIYINSSDILSLSAFSNLNIASDIINVNTVDLINVNVGSNAYINVNQQLVENAGNGIALSSGAGDLSLDNGTAGLQLPQITGGYLVSDVGGYVSTTTKAGEIDFSFAYINAVPGGSSWVLTSNSYVPYASVNYPGAYENAGVSYDNSNYTFTCSPGSYSVDIVQTVNVNNALGVQLSNGRLKLVDASSNSQINQDSGRYETTAGMSGIGILAYDISLTMIFSTPNYIDVAVYCEDNAGGGGGLLLGKGGCKIIKLKTISGF